MNPYSLTLQTAATYSLDSEELHQNKPNSFSFRPSNCGLPLIQLVLEGYIQPTLFPGAGESDSPIDVKKTMAISQGYLWEAVFGTKLMEETFQVLNQVELELNGIKGTCDFIQVTDSAIIVWECKASGVLTLREFSERKANDNWGYLSQLSFYVEAAKSLFPDKEVVGKWAIWATKSNKNFTLQLSDESQRRAVMEINRRHTALQFFEKAFKDRNIPGCVDAVFGYDGDELPLKDFYYGRYAGTCKFHFNKLAPLFIDDDGVIKEEAEENFENLLEQTFNSL
jgi:hypothetical protein